MIQMTREEERRLVRRFARSGSLARGKYLTSEDCERRRREMLALPFPDPRRHRMPWHLVHAVVLGLLLAWFVSEILLVP